MNMNHINGFRRFFFSRGFLVYFILYLMSMHKSRLYIVTGTYSVYLWNSIFMHSYSNFNFKILKLAILFTILNYTNES